MNDTRFDTRSSEWIGDMTVWLRENSADNSERLERLRRNLRQARVRELTPAAADAHALLRSGDEYSSDRRTAGAQPLHGVPHPPPGTGAALPPCALRTVNLFAFPLVLFSPSPYNRLR